VRNRIEEFTVEEKNFAYIDLSGIRTETECIAALEAVRQVIADYPRNSLHTITNISDACLDSSTKGVMAEFMKHNKPYVKHGAIIGFDGIKKIMAGAVFKLSGRNNMIFSFTRERAVRELLEL
jgi:hypothetical protein